MPPKPTCKVVKREGQRGARIDPKGCKVRTTKDAQGNKKKQNKQARRRSSAQPPRKTCAFIVGKEVVLSIGNYKTRKKYGVKKIPIEEKPVLKAVGT